jgi:hypothetical protein
MTLLATGCVSVQEPVPLQPIANQTAKVGVMYVEAVPAETQYTGSIGLLDYAIIAGVNKSLDTYLKSLTFEDYPVLVNEVTSKLQAKGFNAQLIDPPISLDLAKKIDLPKENKNDSDFSAITKGQDIDYLVLIQKPAIGTTRSYYGPVPTSEPLAMVALRVEMVELATGNLLWYRNLREVATIDTPWDEPDTYPNMTNSIYKNFNTAMQKVLLELDQLPQK